MSRPNACDLWGGKAEIVRKMTEAFREAWPLASRLSKDVAGDLVNSFDVSPAAVARIMSGEREVDYELFSRLSGWTGVDVWDAIGEPAIDPQSAAAWEETAAREPISPQGDGYPKLTVRQYVGILAQMELCSTYDEPGDNWWRSTAQEQLAARPRFPHGAASCKADGAMAGKADHRTLVVALYGGPGTGKSSTMASVFADLKWRGYNVEMAPEFAKEKVWEKSLAILGNQIYVFGKQLHTLVRVDGQVSAVITDSPLLLSLIYGKNEVPEFRQLVLAVNARFRTRHFFLRRLKAYNPKGRLQTEDEAKAIDKEILGMLDGNGIPYDVVNAGRDGVDAIVREVVAELGDPNPTKQADPDVGKGG